MRKIIQRLTIQEESISRIDTKDAQDLPEVACQESLSITGEVIIPHTTRIIGDQKGCRISTRLHSCRDRFV